MVYFTGILVGSFNGHENVTIERSCMLRGSHLAALKDAEDLMREATLEHGEKFVAEWHIDVEQSS